MSRFVETTRDLSPEETTTLVNRLLQAMVSVIHAHGGQIDRFMGDGIFAVFGVPQAHESDPEQAIHAALEIRRAAQELGLEVTVGINTGEAYAGEVGSERHQERTVIGPSVNLASRLQALAEPGQILVGAPTYQQTRGSFAFAPLTLTVRGITEPITAYSVLRSLPQSQKSRGIEGLWAPLIGREKPLAALTDAADRLLQEGEGQIVTLVGEAGIGKSRLVSELKLAALGSELPARPLWLEGRCVSIGQPISFGPFIDLLRAHLGLASDASEREAAAALAGAVVELLPEDADEAIPYLGQLLSLSLEERYEERVRYATPEQIRHQTLLKMRDLLLALAQRQPLVLIIEDLHWADDLSLDLIVALMEELAGVPLLLVCVYRPEEAQGCRRIESAASRRQAERYTSIRLQPLTRRESEVMIAALLASRTTPTEARSALLEHAEGNPFFLEEVVRLSIERGILYRDADEWKARENGGDRAVPTTVKSVILSRVDPLPREVKEVLQCAAVLGRTFRRRPLELLCGEPGALDQHLSHLEARELIYRERVFPEQEYAFKHVLTQETVYEAILTRQRRALHQRVGEAIEALYAPSLPEHYELLAHHYSRSDCREKAVTYLDLAGRKSAGRYANQEALSYFEQALQLAADTDAYEPILRRRGTLHLDLYHGREAAADFERLLDRARERKERAQELDALLGLAEAHYLIALDAAASDSPALCTALFGEAQRLARSLDDKAALIRALLPGGKLADINQVPYEQAEADAREALALSREIDDEELLLDCRLMFGDPDPELFAQLEARHDLRRLKEAYWRRLIAAFFSGDARGMIESSDASIRLAHAIGVPPVQYPTFKALAYLSLGEYGQARSALEQEVADEGHRLGAGMKALGSATYYLDLMAFERVPAVAQQAIDEGRLLSRRWMTRWGQILLVSALSRAGNLDEATFAPIVAEREADGWSLPADLMAEVALQQGRLEEASECADRAMEQKKDGNQFDRLAALEVKARLLLRLGRADEAIELAGEGLSLAEREGYRPLIWRLRAAKAEAHALLGERDESVVEYAAAATVIRALAETIDDGALQQGYLQHPPIASILASGRPEERGRA
jgi:class 3 adenylate cyclase/tetratricopeptide (TPR) repeat protein